ncbi:MAG: hypothetical protein CVV00_12765 [Firmicutes bacterium HGW-Firmicutes-5]|nr:MAG: hypothetical protein CVV00_12765 [Firmicutes bacterium HGW-Firmicutes-5]
MSRTENSIKNIKYALIGQMLALVITFISRMTFVSVLSAEYLGINGLFTNILSILSLAEMGIGTAIVYSMYKPIAEKDVEKIKSLMHLFKKTYIIIGLLISVLGIMLTPFLQFFIKDIPDVDYISIIFLMFVINSSISYFYSYKRFLIIANEKKYVASIYRYSIFIGMSICQIIILITTQNYILFLSIELIATFLENILISIKADKMYPYLKEKNILPLETNEKDQIKKNVQALIYHRIGGVVVLGTDNLLISMLIGLVAVGIYSNYLLIISALMLIYGLIFESLTASIGNLGITQTEEKNRNVFYVTNFAAFWVFGFSAIALWNLVNPFIEIWLGSEYLFNMEIVAVLIINFYITGMRSSVRVFKDAHGLYWYDRYKPLAESIINIIASVILANYLGVLGIFLGTMISTITTSFWVEPFVLYKYGFKTSSTEYFKLYLKYAMITIIAGGLTWMVCSFIVGSGIMNFGIKLVICAIIPNFIFYIIFKKNNAFIHLVQVGKREILDKK